MPKSASILVVDDDPVILDLLSQQLGREGHKIATAANHGEMQEILEKGFPDLVILDLGLPDNDGFSIARDLRGKSDIGIIILTGKDDPVDKVVGLEIGADDYITKPFNSRELLARVNSTLRRVIKNRQEPSSSEIKMITFAGWKLDLVGHELFTPKDDSVHLTGHEFQLLVSLASNPNRVKTRDSLMDAIGGRDWNPTDRSIDVLIGRLRHKIEKNSKKPAFIKSVRGVGYKFTVDVQRLSV